MFQLVYIVVEYKSTKFSFIYKMSRRIQNPNSLTDVELEYLLSQNNNNKYDRVLHESDRYCYNGTGG